MGDLDIIIRQAQGEWETRDVELIPYRQHVEDLGKQFKSIEFRERHVYCNTVEVEPNVQPWYHDIKRFFKTKEYPEQASGDQKRTIRRHAIGAAQGNRAKVGAAKRKAVQKLETALQ
uniref:Uncharacterized protein n=1 Tax=Nicotiana tabacum TaxID=4097 RepID=A0A1S3ZTI3_TOBAC|nr:PREDICTED: uncharacterized protein LOC107790284 [Nicotiana tabacum]